MNDSNFTISPQQISYILELNNERNFQRASEKCFVTQPSLSMQIKKVEDLLGFVIFDRSQNPLVPTKEGEQLIDILKDIQLEYSRVNTLIHKLKGTHKEYLKVAIIPTISSYLITDIYEVIQREIPHLQLSFHELKSEELVVEMEDNKYDLGIMAGPYLSKRLRTVHLFQEEIKIYMPSTSKTVIQPEELVDEQPWLLSKGNCLRTQMVHFCQLENQQEAGTWNYEGGNMEILTKMVDLNGGYTLVPENYKYDSKMLKQLMDPITKEHPARQIISLVPNKSTKLANIDTLNKLIQAHYNTKKRDYLRIIDWK